METIVKCTIEKLAFPIDGYTYNVMEWHSVDGGKNLALRPWALLPDTPRGRTVRRKRGRKAKDSATDV